MDCTLHKLKGINTYQQRLTSEKLLHHAEICSCELAIGSERHNQETL